MNRDVAPVEPPVDDGCGDTNGYAGESHCLAPGSLDGLLGRGHHLGRHAAKLITAVRTVRFLVTVEAGRDALVGGDASELCGPTYFPRVLDGTVGLIRMVLTIKVTVTTPQLESTVSVSTGELIRLAGGRGPCVDKVGAHHGCWLTRTQSPHSRPMPSSPQPSSSLPSLQSSCPSHR